MPCSEFKSFKTQTEPFGNLIVYVVKSDQFLSQESLAYIHAVIFVVHLLAVQLLSFQRLVVTICNPRLKSKQDRQCTYNVTLARVHVAIVTLKNN